MNAKYVPIDAVAEHFSVSVSTIRTWLRQDMIPQDTYIKVGTTYRFCIPDVSEALLHYSEQLAAAELPAEEGPHKAERPYTSGPETTEPEIWLSTANEETDQGLNLDLLDEDQ